MTCAKKRVFAKMVTADGSEIFGSNDCRNPQERCPRVGDLYARDDYSLCKIVCDQQSHAEVSALRKAGARSFGSTMYISHHRVCSRCEEAMIKAGVKRVVTGGPASHNHEMTNPAEMNSSSADSEYQPATFPEVFSDMHR